ncbi:MAG: serine hydrolase domain-containing protein, partial [Steroidobacter sp.]
MTTLTISWRQLLGMTAPLLLTSSLATADPFDSARTRIQNVMTAHDIASVSVAVAHREKIIWEQSFGWADVERRIPATPRTPYLLASITKPMTATAIMMLMERGAIDLDQPIDRYLGVQKITARIGNARDATVRRVAAHTAGLPLHGLFTYSDESGSPPPIEETFRRYGVIVNPPGESFVYSNLGYGLLEAAIERASGKSYSQFLTDELFAPLGLNDSTVNAPEHGAAIRYWGQRVVPTQDTDAKGAGAVFMSAHDLVRFGMFHLHGRLDGQRKSVLQPATLAAMHEATRLNDGSSSGYGVGWFVGEQHGLRYFGHNGGNAGTATVLAIYPDQELVIVVLGNGVSRSGAVHFLENDIIHALLPETIRN